MIVFKYFYEKMALFGPLMDKKEEQEKTQQKLDIEVDLEPMDQVSTTKLVKQQYKVLCSVDSALPYLYMFKHLFSFVHSFSFNRSFIPGCCVDAPTCPSWCGKCH